MNFHAISQELLFQFAAVRDAAIPFGLALVGLGLLIWRAVKWTYEAKLRRLRKVIEHRDSEILFLTSRAETAPRAPERAAPEPGSAEASARRKALRAITNGIDGASAAAAIGGRAEAERAMPNLWLGLLQAQRTFGLAIPTMADDPVQNLATGQRLLELARPALMIGDEEEARRIASEFLRRSGLTVAQDGRAAA